MMTTPQNPESPIRIQISDQMMVDGIAVRIALRYGHDDVRIMKFNEEGYSTIEPVDPLAIGGATFQLPHEFGRALLDALIRYYQGSGDCHTLRSDFLHERGRVDKMIDTISTLAARPQTIEPHKAER